MCLPGGYWHNGTVDRTYAFKPVTGHIELALYECKTKADSLPVMVTQVLTAALDSVGGTEAAVDAVRSLSVGDRQFLMRRLAIHLGDDEFWLTAGCSYCRKPMDALIQLESLPVKRAKDRFPFVDVQTRQGVFRFRVPNGSDQEAIVPLANESEALRALIQRLVVMGNGVPFKAELADEDEIRTIEAALEETAPEIATEVHASCPNCGGENRVAVEPYDCLLSIDDTIFSEIHRMASQYHWSECDILSLSRNRRKRYLRLIDRS